MIFIFFEMYDSDGSYLYTYGFSLYFHEGFTISEDPDLTIPADEDDQVDYFDNMDL